MTAIAFSGVTKRFGSTLAVNSVSLQIARGELFFLLGPSGCGKTTLLRMIAGFTAPDAGEIRFDGQVINSVAPQHRDCGMVFQNYALWPHLTVAENVAFGLQVRQLPSPERRQRVREALELVQLQGLESRKPGELSGGQQQRVALARALIVRPRCLLLDEPLSNLDAKLRLEMRSEIRRLCKQAGLTTVYVTHDQKEALSMADRVALMCHGEVVQCDSPQRLYRSPATHFAADFLGETNLFPATVLAVNGRLLRLDTPFGECTVSNPGVPSALNPTHAPGDEGSPLADKGPAAGRPREIQTGQKWTCAVRPEAIRLGEPNQSLANVVRFQASVLETTYLGEMSQHRLRINHELALRAMELNPGLEPPTGFVRGWFETSDLILLAD